MMLDLLSQDEPEIANYEYIKFIKKASDNLTETIANLNEVVLMNTSGEHNLVPIEPNIKVMGVPAYIDSIVLNFITNGIKYRALVYLAK